jgi:hypothetical protein
VALFQSQKCWWTTTSCLQKILTLTHWRINPLREINSWTMVLSPIQFRFVCNLAVRCPFIFRIAILSRTKSDIPDSNKWTIFDNNLTVDDNREDPIIDSHRVSIGISRIWPGAEVKIRVLSAVVSHRFEVAEGEQMEITINRRYTFWKTEWVDQGRVANWVPACCPREDTEREIVTIWIVRVGSEDFSVLVKLN